MSRFLIKQRVFSWTDTYYVYDEAGNPILFIKSDWLSLGHRIRVFDNSTGEEIGIIQEKIFRIFKEFEISINGYSQGIIKQRFSFFRPVYDIDYRGWHLEGDFMEWNYDIYAEDRLVVMIRKQLFQWGDTYVLDVYDNYDDLPAIMIAIAMDAAKCSSDEQRNTFW